MGLSLLANMARSGIPRPVHSVLPCRGGAASVTRAPVPVKVLSTMRSQTRPKSSCHGSGRKRGLRHVTAPVTERAARASRRYRTASARSDGVMFARMARASGVMREG